MKTSTFLGVLGSQFLHHTSFTWYVKTLLKEIYYWASVPNEHSITFVWLLSLGNLGLRDSLKKTQLRHRGSLCWQRLAGGLITYSEDFFYKWRFELFITSHAVSTKFKLTDFDSLVYAVYALLIPSCAECQQPDAQGQTRGEMVFW